jgi:ubiquinone/menaquinone biosynthesis C-methylase UbiE
MGEAMNYNGYADRYRRNRFAVDWLLDPLINLCAALPDGARVVDLGCGTGNYIWPLWRRFADLRFHGFDRSVRMLEQAAARAVEETGADGQPPIEWRKGDADRGLPYSDGFAQLVFSIDVVHHLEQQEVLFAESARVLSPGGHLAIATDGPEDLLVRTLTRLFPETLEVEQRRYPEPQALDAMALAHGFVVEPRAALRGVLELTDAFVAKLNDRCASSLRLIPDQAFEAGMARVRDAARRKEPWHSAYTLYLYER